MPSPAETLPLVAFNFDHFLTIDTAPTEESERFLHEARVAIDSARRYGRTALLSALPLTTTIAAVRQAGLGTDEVHAGLRTAEQRRDKLGQVAAWGYVGDSRTDIKIAKAAGVKAIGVTTGRSSRTALWQAGADMLLSSVSQLPDRFWFNFRPAAGYLTKEQAAAAFGVGRNRTLPNWIEKDTIPYETDAFGHLRIPEAFVAGVMESAEDRPISKGLVDFYHIEWSVRHGMRSAHDQALAKLQALRDSGEAYDVGELARLAKRSRQSVTGWTKTGRIPAILVQRQYFYRKEDISWLGDFTIADIAGVLGTTQQQAQKLVYRGRIPQGTKHGPQTLRYDNEAVLRYAEQLPEIEAQKAASTTIREAHVLLDLSIRVLNKWARAGRLKSEMRDGKWYFDSDEVIDLRDKWYAFRPRFAWLASVLRPTGDAPGRTAARLGIHPTYLARLADQDIVPYNDRSLPDMNYSRHAYPRDYMQALLQFAGGPPVSKEVMQQFAELCQKAGRIVIAKTL